MRAVIMAGGKGTRLAPYSTVLPKPMMPVGDMPILELLVRQLQRAGVGRITLAVGHLASLLMAYFQDGVQFGLRIDYSVETEPLGTAGPLALVEDLDETFLVMNGDLLTDLDFSAMIDAHRRRGVAATLGVYERIVKVDLGVVETALDDSVTRYVEKPESTYLVSMGVYVFDPSVLGRVTKGVPLDLPDLIGRLLHEGAGVAAHRHHGYWLDIGRPDDFQRAQEDAPAIQRMLLQPDEPA